MNSNRHLLLVIIPNVEKFESTWKWQKQQVSEIMGFGLPQKGRETLQMFEEMRKEMYRRRYRVSGFFFRLSRKYF